MEVKDFLSTYPITQNSRDFESKLFHLKEFYDEKLSKNPQPHTSGLLKHQKVLSRFLAPHTAYRNLLVVHEVGTGKTCAAFAIAEANKGVMKRTYFISPSKDLNTQQKIELVTRCFPAEYSDVSKAIRRRKAGNIRNKDLPFYTFVTPQVLAKNIRRYSDSRVREIFSNSIFIVDEVHKIKEQGEIDKEGVKKLQRDLSKIDRTKNSKLYREKKLQLERKKKEQINSYNELYRLFRVAENIKVVLMSATPMADRASEIVGLINLISPNKLPNDAWKTPDILKSAMRGKVSYLKAPDNSTKKEFMSEYYDIDFSRNPMKAKNGINTTLLGIINSLDLNLVTCKMSPILTAVYLRAWCNAIYKSRIDAKKYTWSENLPTQTRIPSYCKKFPPFGRQNTLAEGAKQAGLFIIGSESNKWKSPTMQDVEKDKVFYGQRLRTLLSRKPESLLNGLRKIMSGSSDEEKLKKLYRVSPKYAVMIRKLLEAYGTKKCFVYIIPVSGSGANMFVEILKLFGYSNFTGTKKRNRLMLGRPKQKRLPSTKGKRFLFFSGQTNVDKTPLMNIYNQQENATGEFIQLIIGTETITQGFTIKDVQEMHIVDPPWNFSGLDQAIGRVVRKNSHEQINNILGSEVSVKLYLYTAVPDLDNGVGLKFRQEQKEIMKIDTSSEDSLAYWDSIDLKKYHRIISKDKEIRKVERYMKESAFDCPLFYQRNVRNGTPGSRECDYASCDYNCDNVNMDLVIGSEDIVLDSTNFDLFYESNLINTEILRLVNFFREFDHADFLTLVQNSKSKNQMIVLKALEQILVHPSSVSNFDLKYICENDGVYYTVRENKRDFNGKINSPLLIENRSDKYISELGNYLSSQLLCDPSKIRKLVQLETPLVQEMLVENSVFAVELNALETELDTDNFSVVQENLGVAEEVIGILNNKLEQTGDGTTISTILRDEKCGRCFDKEKMLQSGGIFCGKKTSWARNVPWYDCDFELNTDIVKNLTSLLKKCLGRKQRYLGLGQGDSFTTIDLADLYPNNKGVPDLTAEPSRNNLPLKNQYKNSPTPSGDNFIEAVEARKINKGIKAKSNNTHTLKKMIKQLNPNWKAPAKKLNSTTLLDILLSELKSKGNWMDLPVGKEFDLTKKDLIKIYDRILPAV